MAVWPDSLGFSRNIQRAVLEFPKHKQKHSISIMKVETHPLCQEVIVNMNTLMKDAEAKLAALSTTHTSIEVKGKGFLSLAQLEEGMENCEALWKLNKDITEMVKALDSLAKIPAPKKKP